MKAYYHARAPEYDDWWLGQGLYADRDRPGWEEDLDELIACLGALPPAKTLDVACGTGFLTRHLPGEVVGLDQSPAMIEVAREQAPDATFVVGDALDLPFSDGAFERLFTSYFYCHLEEADRLRFIAEARRVAAELVLVGGCPSGRRAGRAVGGARAEERLEVAGVQAVLRPGIARRRARRRHHPARGSLVRRRPGVTARFRSLASLQRANRGCRACAEAGFRIESRPVVEGRAGQRAYLLGQAPGSVEGAERRPWRGRAGRTLRAWLGLDEDEFYAAFYCAAMTRCYPGRAPSGRGDRTPTATERKLCSFWREHELRLLQPALVVTVGGLATRELVGVAALDRAVGRRFELGSASVVPLPHPSGASGWLNDPSNRSLLDRAIAIVRVELARL